MSGLLCARPLRRGMGEVSFSDVQTEFQRRREEGEFRSVQGQKYSSGPQLHDTGDDCRRAAANVRYVLDGQGAAAPMLSTSAAEQQAESRDFLNEAQQTAIREVLTSTDRIHGFQGLAGTGKTSTLAAHPRGRGAGWLQGRGLCPDLESSNAAPRGEDRGQHATELPCPAKRCRSCQQTSLHAGRIQPCQLQANAGFS